MGSLELLMEDRRALLTEWQSIYNRHQYIDAFKASFAYWTDSPPIDELSAGEMVFAARLSSRLGGMRISRYLYRKALERDPSSPLVRYFTSHISNDQKLLVDQLLEFEKDPELGGIDIELRASWLAAHAHSFGILRDFSRSWDLLGKAHEIFPNSAWIFSQEADILGMADRWRDALRSAERGCQADPRSPWPILSGASALLNLGEVQEAAQRISQAAAETQFCGVVQSACWYNCALAETLDGDERLESLETARKLAERIEPMAPLADREFKASLARARLDLAELNDDHAAMERWAREARSPFHRTVLANLKANLHGNRIRLPFKRSVQKHVECVPTSIASALSATGAEISIEAMANEVTFGGTAEWAAADWLRGQDFHVRFFSATAELSARLIEAGIGFTISWDDDQSGHAVAIVGIDLAAGTVIVHDPSSFRIAEYLLSSLVANYGPLGIPAMAAVPLTRAEVLDEILTSDSAVVEAAEAQRKALALNGLSESRSILERLEARLPDHSGTHYLRAIQDIEEGRIGRAFAEFRKLFENFQNSPAVRSRLMDACRSLGDTAMLRDTLKSVVETGKVPGMDSQNEWIRPHPRYVCDYADLLRFSAETWTESESLLRKVLKYNCAFAGAWHILADLRWVQKEYDSALLAYRIASTLAEHNEHYASAYAQELCRRGSAEDGIEWMRCRAVKLGKSIHGISTWISYLYTLEEWGNPERALTVCHELLGRFTASPSLLTFAISFFGRMGQWLEGENWLEELKNIDDGAYFQEAAVSFFQMRGLNTKALEHAEIWVSMAPSSIPARSNLLTLIAAVRGRANALDRAALWMRERPENEEFEELFCQYVDFPVWRKLRVLTLRVERNHDDAWAWRELALHAISRFESSDENSRRRLLRRVPKYLAELDRLTFFDAATFRVKGLWQEAQCNWKEARACYLESIRLEPGNSSAYGRMFEIFGRFSAEENRLTWAEQERRWLTYPGHLPHCLQMIRNLNDLLGPRETEHIVAGWLKQRPDDPNAAEAMADLLLDYGHGRSDAIRALELLEPLVERFPYHFGLRFSLARAWRATGDDVAAARVFGELVLHRPDNVSALIQLAWIHERDGQTENALELLARAADQEPQNPDPIDARTQILIENYRYEEAIFVIDGGLQSFRKSVRMYERAIALFAQCGEDGKAVEAARKGVREYAHGAYLWLLLGKALRQHSQFAATGEIEQCFRRSLQLNHGLYESADWLTIILAEQRRYEEAFEVLTAVELRMTDPSRPEGRRAWIKRQAGKRDEAVTDLMHVLRRFPGYLWGCNTLLEWLTEDKCWDLSKEVLASVPAQLIAEIGFRRSRLLLLETAKAEAAILDSEWHQLLSDFPEDISLHLHRYDSLRDANRWEEANTVLNKIEKIAGDDIYFLARLAELRSHQGKDDQALDCALKVCFAPVERSDWPVNHVWKVFQTRNNGQRLAEKFRSSLDDGVRPTRRAISRYAESLLSQQVPSSRMGRLVRQTRLNHVTREAISLMRVVESSSRRSEFHLSDLFSILNSHHYSRLVIRYWKTIGDQRVDGDSDAWAQAGRAFVTERRYKMARTLFHDWRNRRGVQMWSLANYVQSLSRFRRQDLKEVLATCNEALADLPHDHCARYLSYMQAEACALLNDKQGLLSVWKDRSAYFDGDPGKDEYFKSDEKYLIYEIPRVVESLQHDDRSAYRQRRWRICLRRLWSPRNKTVSRRIVKALFILFGIIAVTVAMSRS